MKTGTVKGQGKFRVRKPNEVSDDTESKNDPGFYRSNEQGPSQSIQIQFESDNDISQSTISSGNNQNSVVGGKKIQVSPVKNEISMKPHKAHRRSSRHQMAACCNCKRRRKKCDGKYPICSSCEHLNLDCTMIFAPTGKEIPRNYIETLETKINVLEGEIEAKKLQRQQNQQQQHHNQVIIQQDSKAPNAKKQVSCGNGKEDFAQQVGMITVGSAEDPRYIGEASAYSIAKAIARSISCYSKNKQDHIDAVPGDKTPNNNKVDTKSVSWSPSLKVPFFQPSSAVAQNYLEAYKEAVQYQYPFMDWDEVQSWFKEVMDKGPNTKSPDAKFFIYMIFAMGTQLLDSQPGTEGCTRAYYDKAFESVCDVVEQTTLHAVQAFLLLAVFSQKVPDGASVWQTTGLAIRGAVALGLHRNPHDSGLLSNRCLLSEDCKHHIDQMRLRVFWSAYGIERMNGLVLGRPFSISDLDIDAPMPELTPETKVAIEVIKLRRIQSEISDFVNQPSRFIKSPEDQENARKDIVQKLNSWIMHFPCKDNARTPFEVTNWPVISYHNSITVLLRPLVLQVAHLQNQASQGHLQWFRVFAESTSVICLSYKSMYLKGLFRYMWLTVHSCFVAGISFLYCIWLDQSLHILKWKNQSIIYETIAACSSILYVLAERWRTGCIFRDTFERLASIVKDGMNTNSITNEKKLVSLTPSQSESPVSNLPAAPTLNTSASLPATLSMPAEGSDYYQNIVLSPSMQASPGIDYLLDPQLSAAVDILRFPAKKGQAQDNTDKLWELLDTTGDKFLRRIFADMKDSAE